MKTIAPITILLLAIAASSSGEICSEEMFNHLRSVLDGDLTSAIQTINNEFDLGIPEETTIEEVRHMVELALAAYAPEVHIDFDDLPSTDDVINFARALCAKI